jgi:hypothetical protein
MYDHHALLASANDDVTGFNVQKCLGRMRVLSVLADAVLVDHAMSCLDAGGGHSRSKTRAWICIVPV